MTVLEMKKEEIEILKQELSVFEPNCKVQIRKNANVQAQESNTSCLRVSITFKTDAIYCVHYDLYYAVISEGVYDVYLDGKVVELTITKDGKHRWKRDIPGATFSGSLGPSTIQQIAYTLNKYTTNLIS